jgi:hypothetical protein
MPESLFGVTLHSLTVSRQHALDTAAPVTSPVPVYFIHSFEQPFCRQATCPCHARQQAVVRLLVSIVEGRVELEPAAALLGTEGKEGRA